MKLSQQNDNGQNVLELQVAKTHSSESAAGAASYKKQNWMADYCT